MKKIYAPVLIPTLCRYEHFKKCIESLAQCTDADKTELFIGLDYPAKEAHWEGYRKINAFVDTIAGFKKVYVFRREANYGQEKNNADLRARVKEYYDRYISTEDDNVFSPNFLVYMNEGLERYKNDSNVFCICGYAYPYEFCQDILKYPFNVYPMHGFCAWGMGVWIAKRNAAASFVNPEQAYRLIHSWKDVSRLWKHHSYITVHRLISRHGTSGYFDLMVRVYLLFNQMYCIFPRVSKVRNCGFDGSGQHCMVSSIYAEQEIDDSRTFRCDDIEIKNYQEVDNLFRNLYSGSWWIQILCVIEYMAYRLGINSNNIFFVKIHRFLLDLLGKR